MFTSSRRQKPDRTWKNNINNIHFGNSFLQSGLGSYSPGWWWPRDVSLDRRRYRCSGGRLRRDFVKYVKYISVFLLIFIFFFKCFLVSYFKIFQGSLAALQLQKQWGPQFFAGEGDSDAEEDPRDAARKKQDIFCFLFVNIWLKERRE